MQTVFALGLLIVSLTSFAEDNFSRLQHLTNIKRIAFGSCNDQTDEQPLWRDIQVQAPDLFIWGGDNIYADWDNDGMAKGYEKQNQQPDYVAMKSQIPIIGTWDDHDYAFDNANGSFTGKKESQRMMLDFLEEPLDSLRRKQQGVYTSYEFGEEAKKIKFIMLDNRYFKSLDQKAYLLGETQWQWLENELKNSTAKLHFISVGLSVLSPVLPISEEWADFSSELNRMLALLAKYKPQGVVFLTGDKHFASIFKRHGHLEFMSSGMTHVAPKKTWWYLARKYPKTYFGLNYGQIDIAWENSTPILTMAIRSQSGKDIHPSKFQWIDGNWEEK